MTFSLFSVFILLILSCTVCAGIFRGMRRGMVKSLIALVSLIVSLVVSVIISPYLSLAISDGLAYEVADLIGLPQSGYSFMGARVFASILISSFIFYLFFILVKLFLALLLSNALNNVQKGSLLYKDIVENPASSRKYGALIGAFCGLVTAVIIVSPLMGTLNSAKTFISIVEIGDKASLEDEDVKAEVQAVKKYSADAIGSVLYHMGGDMIYHSAASSMMNDNTVYLVNELEAIESVVREFVFISPVISRPDLVRQEHLNAINALCDSINDVKLMHVIISDMLPGMSNIWLRGGIYMGIRKPDLGKIFTPAFDDILKICSNTNPYIVKNDVTFLLRVYYLLIECGAIACGDNQQALMDCMDSTGFIDKIYDEIDKNPNMYPIRRSISDIAMRMIADRISNIPTSEKIYKYLSENIAEAIMNISSKGYGTEEEMVDALSVYAEEFLADCGISVSNTLSKPIAQAMISGIGANTWVTPDEVENFIRNYVNN